MFRGLLRRCFLGPLPVEGGKEVGVGRGELHPQYQWRASLGWPRWELGDWKSPSELSRVEARWPGFHIAHGQVIIVGHLRKGVA